MFSGVPLKYWNTADLVLHWLRNYLPERNTCDLKIIREKGRDLTQSYDKSPYTNRNVKRAKWQHKQRHKKVRLNSGCGLANSQGARYFSISYVAARKLCLVVDGHVKIWSCTLSYKNFHLTLLCLQHHFGTILTIFGKFRYYFDFDNLAITLQPSRLEELCPFLILIEKYPVLQLLWCEKSQSKGIFLFFRTKIGFSSFLSDEIKSISNF